ncbi:hypothetical protein [Micromonospora sp. WMMD980]|uniref:hypothetical protein n=1 Tax=Micromonospora sp. WMMD980 TaxID=3016088 RepID=UPI002417C1A6|nr:hypothetical protein [Micromonospora sp. WMMD980]MDG4803373.1 hypothetical protein [Micromonospora sp. WMMD980]
MSGPSQPPVAHQRDQAVQPAPEGLGERLQVVVPGERAQGLGQPGEASGEVDRRRRLWSWIRSADGRIDGPDGYGTVRA